VSGLTHAEREHIEGVGADAVDALVERWAIMVEDGHVAERTAWRLAYERTCKHFGVKPRAPQAEMFA
jgi:hypothetical protein